MNSTTRTLPLLLLLATVPAVRAQSLCVGDCDGDARVRVHELILGVRIMLGDEKLSECSAVSCDGDPFGPPINCMITAVTNSLDGCDPLAGCGAGCFNDCFSTPENCPCAESRCV